MKAVEPRLMAHVEFEPNTGCWLWSRSQRFGGYGQVTYRGKAWAAHRLFYAQAVGDPTGMKVCHKCDTPACCNPDHLFLGTQADNVADMYAKGRDNHVIRCGEASKVNKLTEAQVIEARNLRAQGKSWADIASRFPSSSTAIRKACGGITWIHVARSDEELSENAKRLLASAVEALAAYAEATNAPHKADLFDWAKSGGQLCTFRRKTKGARE